MIAPQDPNKLETQHTFIAAKDLQPGMKLAGPPGCPPLDILQVEAIFPITVSIHVLTAGIINMNSWQPVALA